MSTHPHKGFTLLIAVILSSVALAVGLALLDISYKQVVLATAAKQSQVAFYAADSVMECTLYYDQKLNAFDYTAPNGSLTCNSLPVQNYTTSQSGGTRTTSFTVPCSGGTGVRGLAKIYKSSTGSTQIYTTGYNLCDTTNTRRIERGLKTVY